MHDDKDVIVFNDNDLEITDDEIALSKELESQEKDNLPDESKKDIFMDDMDDYSDFDEFNIQSLDDANESTFELKSDNTIVQDVLNFSKIDNGDQESGIIRNKKTNDIKDMDFDRINEYLDIQDDPSLIKTEEQKKKQLIDENIDYLDEDLSDKISEHEKEKEKLKDMTFDELGTSLDIQAPIKEETKEKGKNKMSNLLNKFSKKKEKKDDDDIFVDDSMIDEMLAEKEDTNIDFSSLQSTKEENTENVKEKMQKLSKETVVDKTEDMMEDKSFTPLGFDGFDEFDGDTYENEKIEPFQSDHQGITDDEITDLIGDKDFKPNGFDEFYDGEYDKDEINEEKIDITPIDIEPHLSQNEIDVLADTADITPIEKEKKKKSKKEKNEIKVRETKEKREKEPKQPKEKKPMNFSKFVPIIIGVLAVGIVAEGVAIHKMNSDLSSKMEQTTTIVKEQENKLSEISSEIQTTSDDVSSKMSEVDTKSDQMDEKIKEVDTLKENIQTVNYTDLINNTIPMIVSISSDNSSVDQNQHDQYVENERLITNGSGVIIDKNDNEVLILTNKTVVDGIEKLSVIFNNGKTVSGNIKSTDNDSGLAVVSVEKSALDDDTFNNIAMAEVNKDNTVALGNEVLSIGNGLGYGKTATKGIVSATDKVLTRTDSSVFKGLIQTDAAIQPGNNGGAVINTNGKLVGIALMSSTNTNASIDNVGFVIPVSVYADTISNLKNTH